MLRNTGLLQSCRHEITFSGPEEPKSGWQELTNRCCNREMVFSILEPMMMADLVGWLLGTRPFGGQIIEAAFDKLPIVAKRPSSSSSLLGLAVMIWVSYHYEYTDKCMSSHGRQFDPGRGQLLCMFLN